MQQLRKQGARRRNRDARSESKAAEEEKDLVEQQFAHGARCAHQEYVEAEPGDVLREKDHAERGEEDTVLLGTQQTRQRQHPDESQSRSQQLPAQQDCATTQYRGGQSGCHGVRRLVGAEAAVEEHCANGWFD